jgi:hypothetical protein
VLSQLDTSSSFALVGFGLNVSDDIGSFGEPGRMYSGKEVIVIVEEEEGAKL